MHLRSKCYHLGSLFIVYNQRLFVAVLPGKCLGEQNARPNLYTIKANFYAGGILSFFFRLASSYRYDLWPKLPDWRHFRSPKCICNKCIRGHPCCFDHMEAYGLRFGECHSHSWSCKNRLQLRLVNLVLVAFIFFLVSFSIIIRYELALKFVTRWYWLIYIYLINRPFLSRPITADIQLSNRRAGRSVTVLTHEKSRSALTNWGGVTPTNVTLPLFP